MKIAVVGLGLIGGSIAKSLSGKSYYVIGYDKNTQVCEKAVQESAVREISEDFTDCDIVFVALYPNATVEFIKHTTFKQNAVVMDLCGVKSYICAELKSHADLGNYYFIGAHPMAGREISGFNASIATLFEGASMILTPFDETPKGIIDKVKEIIYKSGFAKIIITTPQNHDEIIAFTSQLPHLISNAYLKSPCNEKHMGYSAGSYRDTARVGKLNTSLWSELFLNNKEYLIDELSGMIKALGEYREALKNNDEHTLKELIK